MYSQIVGPVDVYIKAICKNGTYSEFYEVAALCSVLGYNIRSVCPKISHQAAMPLLNSVLTPASHIVANGEIAILWSNVCNERDAQEANNGSWSPNHFVPLLSAAMDYESEDSVQSTSLLTVGYLFINENSKILKVFFFRLLKRRRSRIILSLKYGFLNFSLLLAGVYVMKITWEMNLLSQVF